jgi:hypothetical protein
VRIVLTAREWLRVSALLTAREWLVVSVRLTAREWLLVSARLTAREWLLVSAQFRTTSDGLPFSVSVNNDFSPLRSGARAANRLAPNPL